MKKWSGILVLILSVVFVLTSCSKQPDRAALVSLMEQYLAALAEHNPDAVPLAQDVKLVENTQVTPVGEGLWKTATGGPTDFKIFVADPVAGQVAFMGVIQENDTPTILAARLKVVDGQITEIDHLVVHSMGQGQPLSPLMTTVNPPLLESVDPANRVPREEMLKIANSYYEAIVNDDGALAPFADDCQRRENGGITAGKKPDAPDNPDDDFAIFSKMKCGEQLSTGVMSYITDINNRRFIAVDEEKGLVFVYSIFRHDGEPKVMNIIGVPGVTERENNWGPFDLPAAHVFKIENGQLKDIEAIGYIAPHGIKNGWES